MVVKTIMKKKLNETVKGKALYLLRLNDPEEKPGAYIVNVINSGEVITMISRYR